MAFKVGEHVWIPSVKQVKEKFGADIFDESACSTPITSSMQRFCGQHVTICRRLRASRNEKYIYKIKEDNEQFYWPDIFESIKSMPTRRNTSLSLFLHHSKGIPLNSAENDEVIIVGDYVEIVATGATYDYYRDWIKTHCPEFENDFKEGEVPPLGAIGRVVGKGEHLNRDNMLYGVYIEENDRFLPNVKNRVFCIDESGIKKLKPYRISN